MNDDRLAKEQAFHDQWASELAPESVLVDASWTAQTCPEHRWIWNELGGDVAGKRVLDVGTGAGEAAVWFAKHGASVVASDISPRFLELTQRVARHHGVSVETAVGDLARLDLPAASFDIIYAGNVLHHVDFEPALARIRSLLKPGGHLVSWDPLCHNPVINVYRRLASAVRTDDERPLSIHALKSFRKHFDEVRYACFWFTTLWLFLRFFLIEWVHPSKQRYWKKIIVESARLTPTHRRLEALDRRLLAWFPYLQRHCWNLAVIARRPLDDRHAD